MKLEVPEAFAGLFRPSRYKAFYGGRGSAKSHSVAKSLLIRGGQRPLRILCAREVQATIQDSVKQLLDDQIDALGMSGFYHSIQNTIRGRNGTSIIFAGLGKLTSAQIKSMEGVDIAWTEEAQTVSADSLEVLIPTIRKPGSELIFTWNPRHKSDPVDKRFRGAVTPPDSIIRRVNYDENPFFPNTLEAERQFDRVHNPKRYAHIWLGEYEPEVEGAIFDRQTFHENRIVEKDMPKLDRIAVALDHAVSAEDGSNEHGIMVGGVNMAKREGYLLDDLTIKGPPEKWAKRVVYAFERYGANAIIIERNQGGDLVKHTLQSVKSGLPIVEVHAAKGKHVRAEPVSAMAGLGRIHHVGTFEELEDQLCMMTAAGFEGEGSADRVDSYVWLWNYLLPQVRPSASGGKVFKADTDFEV